MKKLSSIQVRWLASSQPGRYCTNWIPLLNSGQVPLYYRKLPLSHPVFLPPHTRVHTYTVLTLAHVSRWVHTASQLSPYFLHSHPHSQPHYPRLSLRLLWGLIYVSLLSLSWTGLVVPSHLLPWCPTLPPWGHLSHYNVIASTCNLINHEVCTGRKVAHWRQWIPVYWVLKRTQVLPQEQMGPQVRPRSPL